MVFTTACDHRMLNEALVEPMEQITRILNPD